MTSDTALASHEKHDFVLRVYRCLIADLVQQFNGGHPGGAMGMAAIGTALFKYAMKFSPSNPNYFNRDRFVLSNGHTCLFQYAFWHLVGFEHMTLDQLKSYHSADLKSYAPGHPEIEHPGIEVTTGPLGQGIANAVGLALAGKNLAATYNKPDFPVVSSTIYCMVGDACLQEGVALESISLAGHWGLDNLVVLYDNNQISCDGSVDLTNTEDVNAKFRACNWHVIDVLDGNFDVEGIYAAIEEAKSVTGKPTLINCRTTIGVGAPQEGLAVAHGAAFGEESVRELKMRNKLDPDVKFYLPDELYEFFADVKVRGKQEEAAWTALVEKYSAAYPELAADFARRVRGELPSDWKQLIPAQGTLPTDPTASRKSSGLVFNPVAARVNNFVVGVADLTPSVNMAWKDRVEFQRPDLKTQCGVNGDYTGRYIHYGIREFAMAAISNGIAAYNQGTFIPVTSSFFMFYLYAAPAVRMTALQELQVIHVATHDSIGTGEDGPTHQPIALASFYRALPNCLYIRPCDSEETAGAWEAAIEARKTTTVLSLSRQTLKQYPGLSQRSQVRNGAYVFQEEEGAAVTIIGVGSEMCFAVDAAALLTSRGIPARVVSFPCQRLFEQQPVEYQRSVLPRGKQPIVVVEAYAANGWERYASAGFSMKTFGKSLPGKVAYEYFGYKADNIADKVAVYVEKCQADPELLYEFQDLNDYKVEHY